MIWVTDAEGLTTYICPEWYVFTGLEAPAGLGFGWTAAIHPDERTLMEATFQQACAARCEFALQYRLRRRDGTYVWVSDSAAPAWLPKQMAFLGFLGQISRVEPLRRGMIARAELERFEAAASVGAFAPVTTLDAIAHHILMARALATGGAGQLMPLIDDLLFVLGRDLAQQEIRPDGSGNIH